MIHETERQSRNILWSLSNSDIDFYQTGSRFFGGATGLSDWDFYAIYDRGVIQFLKQYGFARKGFYYSPGYRTCGPGVWSDQIGRASCRERV